LGANSVNGNTGSKPLLDVADHAVHLGVTGGIQALKCQKRNISRGRESYNSLVIVDVQLGIGVDGPGGLEGDAHVVFTDDFVEDAVAQGAVFVEDLVQDVLGYVRKGA
jgi:hypothetical protein